MAQSLRFWWEEVITIAIDEARLIFQNDDRLGHSYGEIEVGVFEITADDCDAALVIFDDGWGKLALGSGRVCEKSA